MAQWRLVAGHGCEPDIVRNQQLLPSLAVAFAGGPQIQVTGYLTSPLEESQTRAKGKQKLPLWLVDDFSSVCYYSDNIRSFQNLSGKGIERAN